MTPMERIEGELSEARERIKELERERDMHQAAEEAQIALRQKADERAAALAAALREAQCITANWYDNEENIGECLNKMDHWAIKTMHPDRLPDCLAKRDLIKQAEALEKTQADLYEFPACAGMAMLEYMGSKSNELRQQAEEINQ